MSIKLKPFNKHHAAEIISWPLDEDEAKAWAGAGTQYPVPENAFAAWHQDDDIKPFIGFIDDMLTAYGEIWVDSDEQEIELARIIVAPHARGKGLGQQFVNVLLTEASKYQMQDLLIRVLQENVKAIRCYENCGFQRVCDEAEKNNNAGQPIEYVWLEYCGSDKISSD